MTLSSRARPGSRSHISWIPVFQGFSPLAFRGHHRPPSPLAPAGWHPRYNREPALASPPPSSVASWGGGVRRAEPEQGRGEPRRPPSPPQGSPLQGLPDITAKHCEGQLPTGVPAACQSGGGQGSAGGRQPPVTTRANCQSGEAQVLLWELRTARWAWPVASQGAHQWSFW